MEFDMTRVDFVEVVESSVYVVCLKYAAAAIEKYDTALTDWFAIAK